MNGNAERLREAGLLVDDERFGVLPEPYMELIDGLSEDEVTTLISLQRRLDDLGIPNQPFSAPRLRDMEALGGIPPW